MSPSTAHHSSPRARQERRLHAHMPSARRPLRRGHTREEEIYLSAEEIHAARNRAVVCVYGGDGRHKRPAAASAPPTLRCRRMMSHRSGGSIRRYSTIASPRRPVLPTRTPPFLPAPAARRIRGMPTHVGVLPRQDIVTFCHGLLSPSSSATFFRLYACRHVGTRHIVPPYATANTFPP